MPTDQNLSGLKSREIAPANLGEFRLNGPTWLYHPTEWPQETDVASTREALVEFIPQPREKMLLKQNGDEPNDKGAWTSFLVKKYKYWKLLRITAYILRFRKYCCRKEKICGPLQTAEIKAATGATGGFFERLIGGMKSALSKAIGKGLLTFSQLEETLLDVECFMNNRPLVYLGEEFKDRTITPNIL